MSPQDLELGQVPAPAPTARSALPPCKGFIAVASKIASDPDKSTTIYRRFDNLSTRNILYYQAELAELEDLQKRYDEEDQNARDESSIECQRDWEAFVLCAQDEGREKRKMDLIMKIRTTLEKYHEALSSHQRHLNATPPSKTTIKAMRDWFLDDPTGTKSVEDCEPQLWGASEQIFTDPSDLVGLRVPSDHDRLSEFIQNNLGILFKSSQASVNGSERKDEGGKQIIISHAAVSTFSTFISLILASILLFGAIISLSVIRTKSLLLGMLCFWTIVFAGCVGLLTNSKRDQVFGATAAYAAVLVVFISGNLASGGGDGQGHDVRSRAANIKLSLPSVTLTQPPILPPTQAHAEAPTQASARAQSLARELGPVHQEELGCQPEEEPLPSVKTSQNTHATYHPTTIHTAVSHNLLPVHRSLLHHLPVTPYNFIADLPHLTSHNLTAHRPLLHGPPITPPKMASNISFAPVMPIPLVFNAEERIAQLRKYLDLNNPDFQSVENKNSRAAIKSNQDGTISSFKNVIIKDGKIVTYKEAFEGPDCVWFEGMGFQMGQSSHMGTATRV
ncbi:hypothetical protein V502_03141 [Pseudogymnoascus sp. VKM F-4520 (FW-2644)]|nr:hypothetical protein V502_03141 [Pseudogymnoascus sp. VKM F-4520 (FW-2644)]